MNGLELNFTENLVLFRFYDFSAATLTAWKKNLYALYQEYHQQQQPFLAIYDFRPMTNPASRGLDYMVKVGRENPHDLLRATAVITSAHTLGLVQMAARRAPRHEMIRVFLEEDRALDWLMQFA